MGRTADRTSARNRAREALAERQKDRREREERLEAAATRYFGAADAMEKARRDAGAAIQALVDEGESRGDIADLLGITTREVKLALDALTVVYDEKEDEYSDAHATARVASEVKDDETTHDANDERVGESSVA